MALPRHTPLAFPQNSLITITPQFDTDLGNFELEQTKYLGFTVTSEIPNVKVICEQKIYDPETNEQLSNYKIKEIEPGFVKLETASTKNLKIQFKANRGGTVVLVFKVKKLKGNETQLVEELKLKYQTNMSNIEVFPENKIKNLIEIGNGSEATIYKAKYQNNEVAIKQYFHDCGMNERTNMKLFKNEFIIEYKKTFCKENGNSYQYSSMLEYAKYGSLKGKKYFTEQHVLLKIFEDICKALQYLHDDAKAIHLDIKPDNILIINYYRKSIINAKLTDFGLCEMIGNEKIRKCGTDYFMAPEVKNGGKHTKKCDIYSFGMTMLYTFLEINLENAISEDEQPNGTYIKNDIYRLRNDIRDLIIKCCQVDDTLRPDINECLENIQDILKKFGDKDIFETNIIEQNDFRYSLPKFDLKESVNKVVESIKKLNITNEFIKAKIMLKLKITTKMEAIELMNNNHDDLLKNKVNDDYTSYCDYIKTNAPESMNKIYKKIITAANESHPDAIMDLIDILIDISKGTITINDEEKNQINKIIKSINDLVIVENKQTSDNQNSTKQTNIRTISKTMIIDIFLSLGKYIPKCELQYGIALLHGVGINKNIDSAESMLKRYNQSRFCEDPQEIEFYQSYCKFVKNNTQDKHKDSYKEVFKTAYKFLNKCKIYLKDLYYDALNNCKTNLKDLYYYPDALNNMGVLLCKGLGCDKNINEGFECFEESMKLNNDYGKFNHTYCLCEHTKELTSKTISKDYGKETMLELANSGLDVAQQFYAFASFHNYLNNKDKRNDYLLQEAINFWALASLQLDYTSIVNLGFCLEVWSDELSDDEQKKCEKISFELFQLASQNGCSDAQLGLIECHRYGKGTKKDLEKAKDLCKKALINVKINEFLWEEWKTKAYLQYLDVLKELFIQNKDNKNKQKSIRKDVNGLVKSLGNNDNPYINFELGMCYYNGILFDKNMNKAIDYLVKADKNNHPHACSYLSDIYYDGIDDPKNMDKAIIYVKKAAKNNDEIALYNLGNLYLHRNVYERDKKKAIECFEKTKTLNNAEVLCNIGKIYLIGKNIKKDINKAIEYFTIAGVKNHADANYELGTIHFNGIERKRNPSEGIRYFKIAAEQNHPYAFFILGVIYFTGDGVELNKKEAIEYFKQASNRNNEYALFQLGRIYLIGDGVEKNIEKAIRYFKKAADQSYGNANYELGCKPESPYANFELARIYLNGIGVPKDIDKANEYLDKASNQKTSDDSTSIFIHYLERSNVKFDMKNVIKCLEQVKYNNYSDLYIQLGKIYLNGNGVKRDPQKAIKYFKEAERLNDPYASFELGNIYLNGNGVEKSEKEAINHFEKVANKDNPYYLYKLGMIFSKGDGLKKDIPKAITYFEKASDNNNLDASYELSKIYFNGNGVSKDTKKAHFYCLRAKLLNKPDTFYYLGVIYLNGTGFDEKDPDRGIDYLGKAEKLNHLEALHYLGTLYHYGFNKVEIDPTKAIGYFEKAAKLNYEPSIQQLKKINSK